MQGPLSAYHVYIRVDRNNKPIDSTNKLLKTSPKQGRWIEVKDITANVCCDTITLNTTPDYTSNNYAILYFKCDGNTIAQLNFPELEWTTIEELVDVLNTNAAYVGVFKLNSDGTSIDLTINNSVKPNCSGVLTYELTAD